MIIKTKVYHFSGINNHNLFRLICLGTLVFLSPSPSVNYTSYILTFYLPGEVCSRAVHCTQN